MPTQNVNISEQQAAFIQAAIASGRYCNASEVVRAGLRLLVEAEEEREMRLQKLRDVLAQGIYEADNGIYAEYSLEKIRKKLNQDSKDAHA